MRTVAVIGAGSWGTAVAQLLARQGHRVKLWSHNAQVAEAINTVHRNPRYLPACELPETVVAYTDLAKSIEGAEAAVFVVPSSHLRSTAKLAAPHIGQDLPVAVLTKGIEYGTSMLMTEVVTDELANASRIACLSGPNHAEEVSLDLPASAVIASRDEVTAAYFQQLFHTDTFRSYISDDVEGVEICAAAKNVIAIACGIVRGYKMGDNTSAVIMTRGLAEMSRLVAARGGNPMTCMGMAGVGDLIATCTSQHSRNQTFGAAFAAGESLEEFESRTHMVVEGARACRSIREMASRLGVEVPIADAVYDLLYNKQPTEKVVARLYARTPGVEFY